MKTSNKKNTALLISILLAVIWIVLVLTLTDFTRLGFTGWLAFLYIPISIALVYYCISLQHPIKNDSSTLGIPIYYSVSFIAIGVIFNGAYLLAGSEGMKKILIALDVVLLAVYFILMLAAGKHIEKVSARIEKSESNTATASAVSRELGKALAMADDKEIHQELLRIKEKVDYAGNSGTSPDDVVIIRKVKDLLSLLSDGTDKATVQELINQLGKLWAARNI